MRNLVARMHPLIRATGRVRLFKSHRAGIADGHQARDFVFVDDVVGVLVGLVERPLGRGIFNLGSGRARTFLDLVNATFHAMGKTPQVDFIDTPVDLQATYQYFTEAPMARLRSAGFAGSPTSLEQGVERYVHALLAASRA